MPITFEEHVKILFKTLLIIGEKGEINLGELAKNLGKNRPQIYTLVQTLESLGLIVRERVKALPPRVVIKPTEKGRIFIECLRKIEIT